MTVDAHAHVFRPATVIPRGVADLVPADRDAPAEGLLELMAAHRVSRAVLVALDEHDDAVAEALAAHPGRFAAVAVATPAELGRRSGDPASLLGHRRERFGFAGLRTTWLADPGRDVRDSPALPALRWCAEHGVVLWAYLPPDQFPLLAPVAALLPDLRVALNHFGFSPHDMGVDEHGRPRFADRLPPSRVDAVCALADHEQVRVLVSGHYALSRQEPPYADLAGPTQRYLDAFGAERVMWGSDMPWPQHVPGYGVLLASVLHALDAAGASPAERDLVLGGAAAELLGLAWD